MIRVLVMIAVAGFVLAVATLSTAVAIGGPDAIARSGWSMASGHWGGRHWNWDWDDEHEGATGPQATRTLAWTGGDSLDVDLPADIRYIQAPGPATITVTGSARSIARVIIRGDSLRLDGHRQHDFRRLDIVMRAPNITSFDLSGRNSLTIENYRQPRLRVDVSGAADVTAAGEADVIDLDISGSGDVDLGGLKAKGADVEISGAGDATVAPTDWAKLDISGMGDVRLLTHPPKLETDITGGGSVRQEEPATAPTPPAPPSPASPTGKKT